MWVHRLVGYTVVTGFGLFNFSSAPFNLHFPHFLHLPLPPSLLLMLIINPYDRYTSGNPSSPDNTPSRTRISFSRKAAPVVSITPTSAISTGQENRSPTSSVPFPSSPPQIPSTESCPNVMSIPCPGDLLPELPGCVQPTSVHRRQRSNSGLTASVQQWSPRPLATSQSRALNPRYMIDLGKSTPILSITSSGTVSRLDHDHLGKTLATSRQRKLQQLHRKRSASMVTKKQTKKASMDSKFLIMLHHSITWHIGNRSDGKGLSLYTHTA